MIVVDTLISILMHIAV